MEFGLIQKSLPHDNFEFSETECLNLNVAVPQKHEGHLPVFVFFHGGGFQIGGNPWPQYDLVKIVRLSMKAEQPLIGINVK